MGLPTIFVESDDWMWAAKMHSIVGRQFTRVGQCLDAAYANWVIFDSKNMTYLVRIGAAKIIFVSSGDSDLEDKVRGLGVEKIIQRKDSLEDLLEDVLTLLGV